ncbi:PREDICTED: defensin-like protein 205 [Camelina sativa]|uniref:Defensin-like protein 205 n=1 Tax=Camelina sativa TaxID=90675 RepID=A0ABM0TU30_CAMSA|nr:PREDICTED: defensin-like protein 205 [Camelina sativa]
MAKTLNSICFTSLLLVLLFISAEIPKSEANHCDKFLGEATVSYPCRERECEAQCHAHYEHSCKGECEDHDHEEHCHCYGY